MKKLLKRPIPLMPPYPGLFEDSEIDRWMDRYASALESPQRRWLAHAIKYAQRKGGTSEDTYRGFRNELERFLLYCFAHEYDPSEFRSGEINRYIEFCTAPPVQWVMLSHYRRFGPDDQPVEHWRPFFIDIDKFPAGAKVIKRPKISQSMIQRQYSFLNQWYRDLLDYEMVRRNPIPTAKRESKFLTHSQANKEPKHFSKDEWLHILEILLHLANSEPMKWERALFVILLMKTCYLRIGDLATKPHYQPTMSDFQYMRGFLFLVVMSKRRKIREVSVPKALEPYIVRYRESRGLDGMPREGEHYPLIAKDRGQGNVGARQLNRIVQEAFGAIEAVVDTRVKEQKERLDRASGRERETEQDTYNEMAALLARIQQATPHLLRHTGATIDAIWRPLPILAEELGHKDPGTTGRIYVNSSLRDRGQSGVGRAIA